MNELISHYKESFERKQRLLIPFYDKKKKLEDLSANEHTKMLILEAESRILKEIIDDLESVI